MKRKIIMGILISVAVILSALLVMYHFNKVQIFILDSAEISDAVEIAGKSPARAIDSIYTAKETKAIKDARQSLASVVNEIGQYGGNGVIDLQGVTVEWVHAKTVKAARIIITMAGMHHESLPEHKKRLMHTAHLIMDDLCDNTHKLRTGKTIDATGALSAAIYLTIAAYEISA